MSLIQKLNLLVMLGRGVTKEVLKLWAMSGAGITSQVLQLQAIEEGVGCISIGL